MNPEAVAGLRFADEAATANALVPELQARNVDLIVALLHEGGEAEAEGGGACPGLRGAVVPILEALDPAVEIVISGHTHERYVCERNGRLLDYICHPSTTHCWWMLMEHKRADVFWKDVAKVIAKWL